MNPLTRFIITGVVLLAPAVYAADAFEGRISMALTAERGETHNMTYEMKGTSIRMDMQGQRGDQVSTIMDLGKRQMIILMHQQRMYMTHQMQDPGARSSAQGHEGSAEPHNSPEVQATGQTRTILGYTCNQFLVKDGDKTTELWLAPGLGMFMGLHGGPGGGGGPFGRGRSEVAAKWEEAFKGKAGFPLLVITRDGSGKEKSKMEVTKIDKGGVSDSDFVPPEGYRQFQMPNLGGMNPFGGG